MLEEYFNQECAFPTLLRNAYGDYTETSRVTENCRFREITTMRRSAHQEVNDSDATIWLRPATVATKGCLLIFEGVYYQVERLTKARKLDDAEVHFVKCDLKITDVNIS